MPLGEYSELDKCHWVKFINSSGEEIPPYAALRVTGTTTRNGEPFFTVAKPTSSEQKWYAINGAAAVSAGQVGECTFTPQAIARYSGGSLTVGDEIGPQNNSWDLQSGGKNFFYLGTKSNNRSLTLIEAVQVNSTASTTETVAHFAFAGKNGQTVTAASTEIEVEFDTTGAYGDCSIGTGGSSNRFIVKKAGLWQHLIRFDVFPEAGASGWQIISSCDVKSHTLAGSHDAALIDLDGNDTDQPLRCVATFYGWIANPTTEIWASVSAGAGGNITLTRMEQQVVYLGTTS